MTVPQPFLSGLFMQTRPTLHGRSLADLLAKDEVGKNEVATAITTTARTNFLIVFIGAPLREGPDVRRLARTPLLRDILAWDVFCTGSSHRIAAFPYPKPGLCRLGRDTAGICDRPNEVRGPLQSSDPEPLMDAKSKWWQRMGF
jgi:hypothetical protein